MIFINDSFNVTDKGYHEIAQHNHSLPRSCQIKKRRHEFNASFEIQTLDGEYEGVYVSLETHLIRTLGKQSFRDILEDGKVQIKLSGDGTRAGTKKHLINVSYTIIGDVHCTSERGNYLLAVVQCPETGECIQKALRVLIEEFNSLESVSVGENEILVEKYIGGT